MFQDLCFLPSVISTDSRHKEGTILGCLPSREQVAIFVMDVLLLYIYGGSSLEGRQSQKLMGSSGHIMSCTAEELGQGMLSRAHH